MNQQQSILYLSKQDIIALGGNTSHPYVRAVRRALELHAQKDFVQPLKPYLRTDEKNGHIADRIIAMPAYVGGDVSMSGLKWIGSKHDNPSRRGIERASGLIILNDPESNYPIAILEASLISGMRTAAVTVIGAQHLAKPEFTKVSSIGCGVIARMQLTSLLEQFAAIRNVYLFDVNDQAANRLAAELRETFPHVTVQVAEMAENAVRQAEVLVTATVAAEPYIPFEWLNKGTFVSNISIMDLHKEVFLRADKVVVDDWDQANREKKVIHQLVLEGRFSREQLHAELGEILIGKKPGREAEDEIIILNPMGMAVEDIASAAEIYRKAIANDVGTKLHL
ncbi:2,3-diaminopropionate biosynthesis protein SbnB [Aneurinibacillus thermoaerophilus]|uniref:2,3-diaminopropionate biosynthesis protein SbnB n=1 Tax=Aneurinibacillus thermoaerophilus TaxID=143495 RepID=UPI002E1B0A74|nr:2,3-diaminopropionate biosynthesis protein SbnB [Aneurinibacillus thermoaerophilus]MED0680505.1 2,3-diaminopropionate biosynthesis protein SbnB [Aneurinibacillus thermoaerophilus]MED0738118.1 2,3-diaminopropionate biosynthesis protein SbnB [Aneurinibacillus thermoaerophilus]MED0764855.1 2,3-diaminopropionate biosynthesis protein SbnB [Aneurinibacillus thermoaerophilus]